MSVDKRPLVSFADDPVVAEAAIHDGESSDEEIAIQHMTTSKYLGGKTITFFGSIVLTINNVSGPGMLALPVVYQQAGIIVPSIAFMLVCVLSSMSATYICDSISRIPGNAKFQKRVEFATAFKHYFGRKWYIIAQVTFVLCLMSQTLASIIATAQVMDGAVVLIFKKTFALEMFPFGAVEWKPEYCTDSTHCVPFEPTDEHPYGQVLSLGYALTLLIIMPMGAMNLDDNIKLQIVSFIMLIVLTGEFCVHYVAHGLDFGAVPWFGDNYSNVVGAVIFNLAFVVTIPSWVNEKKHGVSVNKSVWYSTITSIIGYIVVGLLGAWSYPGAPDNILRILVSTRSNLFTRVCATLFALGIIGLGIPVFCIMMRYTLIVGEVCSDRWASFWGVAFPWLVGWLLYQGHAALLLINWTGNIFNGFVNYVAPMLLALKALGVMYDSRFFSQVCSAMPNVRDTIVSPVPKFLFHRQRTVIFVLLSILVPLVLASLALAVITSV